MSTIGPDLMRIDFREPKRVGWLDRRALIKKPLLILICAALAGTVHARDLQSQAKAEYQACLKASEHDRKTCTFGGCGNALGACYERQIAVFDNDSVRISEEFAKGACAEHAKTTDAQFAALEERLLKLGPFDNTWSGFELRVELAAARNQALSLLASECSAAKKNDR